MDALHEKQRELENYLRGLGSVLIAYSSGVDSTFLLKTAHDVLGDKAVAVTARSCFFPSRETDEAAEFCKSEGIEQIIIDFDQLSVDGVKENPKNRCYLCKKALFSRFCRTAEKRGIPYIAEGSNMDDNGDYRPGMLAVAELGIKSPLQNARLTKAEIRVLSREMGLSTWDKPSYACLATRFAYGDSITEEKLLMADKAEQKLIDLGFRQERVRIHGDIARIEVERAEFERIFQPEISEQLTRFFHDLGFLYVAVDLDGYKTGSMNKML